MNSPCHRICVTPTRNESWIIKQFLAATRLWATHVIVADQGSTDGTLQQLQNTPGVEAVVNDSPAYDESYRQRLLLNRARQISGKRILIGLDADEAISANCLQSKEWERLCEAKPGTILRFRWVNILPGFKQAWIPPNLIPCGFIDDGSDSEGKLIHSPRVPNPPGAPVIDFEDVVVLHFQYVFWERMASKQRWYQAWEYVKHQKKGALNIFREYNHMYGSWEQGEIYPVKPEWLEGYDRAGVGYRSLQSEPVTWWDKDLAQMLGEHGREHFRKVAIWDQDWNTFAEKIGVKSGDLSDPRSLGEKIAHRLLKVTQKNRANWGVRGFEYLLRRCGW